MGKFYNEEYEEVEAFTAEELQKKLDEAVSEAKKESSQTTSSLEAKVKELEEAKEKAETKLTKRSEEYNNLKAKYEETGEKVKGAEAEKKETWEKIRDDMISKRAGDDPEYAEKLLEKYNRIATETIDPSQIENDMKEADAMALVSMGREVTPFSLASNSGAKPPEKSADTSTQAFTDTDEGKATLDVALASMGMKANTNSNDQKK